MCAIFCLCSVYSMSFELCDTELITENIYNILYHHLKLEYEKFEKVSLV